MIHFVSFQGLDDRVVIELFAHGGIEFTILVLTSLPPSLVKSPRCAAVEPAFQPRAVALIPTQVMQRSPNVPSHRAAAARLIAPWHSRCCVAGCLCRITHAAL